jgi:hypothetical protein
MYLGVTLTRRGLYWILELLTQLGSTSNYSAVTDLDTLQITSTR